MRLIASLLGPAGGTDALAVLDVPPSGRRVAHLRVMEHGPRTRGPALAFKPEK